MDVFCIVSICLVVAIAVTVIANSLYEKYMERERLKARTYFLGVMRGYYFYGRPLAECVEKSAVWELWWNEVGDFARPVGMLILSSFWMHGNTSSRLCWAKRDGIAGESEHFAARIVFEYNRREWIYDVRCRRLDPVSFRRFQGHLGSEFTVWHYLDIDRAQRRLIENCTSVEGSKILPDAWYAEYDESTDVGALMERLTRFDAYD